MRKIFFQMMVSLDGYFEPPDKSYDWHCADDDFNRYVVDMLESIDGMIMGRVVYEAMAAYWPHGEGPHAPKMNSLPKYVASRTAKKPQVVWNNARLLEGDAVAAIRELKEQDGRPLSIGGSKLVASLVGTGLVDEYRILVAPVFLGAGTPLLHGIRERLRLKLVKTRTFRSGVVVHDYVP
jgi:dihydrofolate reductase